LYLNSFKEIVHVLVWKPTTWANEDEQCGTQLEIVRDVVDDAHTPGL
jgi:hypothetical protein